MKRILVFIISMFIFLSILTPLEMKETKAYSSKCTGYWVGNVTSASSASLVSCVDSYSEGITLMNKTTSTEKSVATLFNGSTIVASAYATLDFTSVGSSSVNSYIYAENTDGTYNSTSDYFNGFYGAEGPYITTGSTTSKAVTIVSGLRGRVNKTRNSYTQYEIVPISASAPKNYYVADTSNNLKHYFAYFDSQSSITIGVAPDFMESNVKYYSYDGHYFYKSFMTMIDDYNNKVYSHAVNSTAPWYNYYQFLGFHTSTNYSVSDLDKYFKAKGYTTVPYTYYNVATNGEPKYPLSNESLLSGASSYFMQMQEIYGINPLLLLTISINESAWGRSFIAITKNNIFGMSAYDSSTSSAKSYNSILDSILGAAKTLFANYFNANSSSNYYYGAILGNKETGVNVKYASDPYWGEKAAAFYYSIDKYLGFKDYNYYTIGVTKSEKVKAYKTASTSSFVYYYDGISRYLKHNPVVIIGESGDYYKVMADNSLSNSNSTTINGFKTNYDYSNNYVYIKKSDITVINGNKYQKPVNNANNNLIRIEYLTEFLPLEVTKDTPIYLDSYMQTKTGSTLKQDCYVTAIERSYTNSQDYTYKVVYNLTTGAQGWVNASDVKEITSKYAIKYNSTHDAIGAKVYSTASTSSQLSSVKYNNEPITIIDSKTVSGTVWYYICYNATNSSFGWTKASDYKSAISHTAPVAPTEPILPPVIPPEDNELTYKSGMFYLNEISANNESTSVTISGLLAIENMTNAASTPLSFHLVLTNELDNSQYDIPLDRWTDTSAYPYKVNDVPGVKYDYSGAWFKATIDFSDIPSGNYSASIETRGTQYYTSTLLSNAYSINITQRFTNTKGTGIEFKTNYQLKTLPLMVYIREEGLLSNTAKASLDNAFIEYSSISLSENKLSIKGTAFSLNGLYSSSSSIKRELIFENIQNYKRYRFNVGSITNGDYKIVLRVDDKKDKTRAWYNATIDLSSLPAGTYAIYVLTTSGNSIEDYGELTDNFFREINITSSDSNKKYQIKMNSKYRNRIELIVSDQ